MTNIDTMASYFVRISQLRDQRNAIDEEVLDKELVVVAIGGFPISWDSFATSIRGTKNASTFNKLWVACTQEESRFISKGNIPNPSEDSQDFATHSKNSKGRRNFGRFQRSIGSIASHDEIWLVDNGASRHMTRIHDHIFELVKNKIVERVDLGDNGKYEFKGIGSSSFQLESRGNVSINNILYVLGLKKNLLSISSLEDKGYRIEFVDGQVLVWKKDSSFEFAKFIGV
eukprot:PITA_17549